KLFNRLERSVGILVGASQQNVSNALQRLQLNRFFEFVGRWAILIQRKHHQREIEVNVEMRRIELRRALQYLQRGLVPTGFEIQQALPMKQDRIVGPACEGSVDGLRGLLKASRLQIAQDQPAIRL